MGNILNLSLAPQHSRPEYMYQGRIWDYQFELWSILICRAISEYFRCKLIYYKGTENNQTKMWTIILCRNALDHIRDKPIYEKTLADSQFLLQAIKMFNSASDYIHKPVYVEDIAYGQFQLWIILFWRAISEYIYCKPIYKKGISIDQFVDLPEDVQGIILSKLPLKEVVRTSVLSSQWRDLWTVCPKLRFDCTIMFGKDFNGKQRGQFAQQFIDTVNAVLQQYHGRIVEELVIKFDFGTLLVDHLNNWVRFTASSHTKFLAFDVMPRGLEALSSPQYIFPFQLLDSRSISHLQLRFVSVNLPTQFGGFPKLRKLDLCHVKVTAKDLQDMLSNCCALEWLCVVHCKMDGELKVHCPLPSLLYLHVAFCELTSMEFHAVKLRTFVYKGSAVRINLNEISELKNANIFLHGATIGDAIATLSNVLTSAQSLTYDAFVHSPEVPFLMENTSKFSQLKHLQLLLSYRMDVDNLSLVPFLGSAPLIEKLEVHFTSYFGFFYVDGESIRRFEHRHEYLKDVCITGFKASNGQIEFVTHIVENAPVLDVLTVEQSDKLSNTDPVLVKEKVAKYMDATVCEVVRRYIERTVSPKCYLRLLF